MPSSSVSLMPFKMLISSSWVSVSDPSGVSCYSMIRTSSSKITCGGSSDSTASSGVANSSEIGTSSAGTYSSPVGLSVIAPSATGLSPEGSTIALSLAGSSAITLSPVGLSASVSV
eukprot:CAMPEP_0185582892 /NCGR_PEP_ID=MMETSP0434-20130131/21191_1 /TAXON_ID=626734 ORGANISM="Favella taraikaensis, Strain Fe Narragansett Bay" /NCGR_SAMPLE_ID=MMETSP0434 /ASSEMBLY_ACC=CAM_ASM_000379 /LENGTH=115 /DNA_ID=CAMNT_0028201843 /DNA_START=573 /DNA_END=920 /DNA_ORIENTATION=-